MVRATASERRSAHIPLRVVRRSIPYVQSCTPAGYRIRRSIFPAWVIGTASCQLSYLTALASVSTIPRFSSAHGSAAATVYTPAASRPAPSTCTARGPAPHDRLRASKARGAVELLCASSSTARTTTRAPALPTQSSRQSFGMGNVGWKRTFGRHPRRALALLQHLRLSCALR